VYHLTYYPDSNSRGSKQETLAELLINKNESWFRSLSTGVYDSLTYYKTSTKTKFIPDAIKYHIRKNFEKDAISYYDQIRMGYLDLYCYEEPMKVLRWNVLDDTLTIGNLVCQKATLNFGQRQWIAYFFFWDSH